MRKPRWVDPGSMLIALVLAALLYAYVGARIIETKQVDVSLRIRVPEGWELKEGPPSSFRVTLQGPREIMESVPIRPLEVVKRPDPRTVTSDTHTETFQITDTEIPVPPGVELVDKALDQVTVHLVRLVPDYVRVKPVYAGEPAPGHQVLRAEAEPKSVKVMVPKGTLNVGEEIETYPPIDITGRTTDVSRWVGVKPKVVNGRLLTSDTDVWVSIIIEKVPEPPVTRTLEAVPVRILHGPLGQARVLEVDPPTVNLEVKGPAEAIEPLSEQKSLVYVDLAEMGGAPRGEAELRCHTHLPSEVSVQSITPPTVTVRIR